MRFFAIVLAGLAAAVANAQSQPNPFNIPTTFSFTAGEPTTITWEPTTPGTVTLILRSGASNNLNSGAPIATSIPNTGSYTWTPDPSVTRGSDYTIQIISDSDPTQVNYTPFFVIESSNTVASTTGSFSLGATSSIPSLSSVSPTSTATGSRSSVSGSTSASGSGSMTTTTSSMNSAASSSASSAASSSSTAARSSSAAAATSAAESVVANSLPSNAAVANGRVAGGMVALAVAGVGFAL
ncbi:hypothetical protein H2199_001316 [Coniosporium tulheliwenetii]|uniref:Uncharacterized protein n=1 Tax=Coniosporium tulheliwenetii TaxID=3383036 RepID=A0ACC2ZLW4_9PEZI|nr:hypothetical protein H2199_001316 [Cladosporium sp. JES 115]